MTVDLSQPTVFPNGRGLADDVIDTELNLISGGAVPSDCVAERLDLHGHVPVLRHGELTHARCWWSGLPACSTSTNSSRSTTMGVKYDCHDDSCGRGRCSREPRGARPTRPHAEAGASPLRRECCLRAKHSTPTTRSPSGRVGLKPTPTTTSAASSSPRVPATRQGEPQPRRRVPRRRADRSRPRDRSERHRPRCS